MRQMYKKSNNHYVIRPNYTDSGYDYYNPYPSDLQSCINDMDDGGVIEFVNGKYVVGNITASGKQVNFVGQGISSKIKFVGQWGIKFSGYFSNFTTVSDICVIGTACNTTDLDFFSAFRFSASSYSRITRVYFFPEELVHAGAVEVPHVMVSLDDSVGFVIDSCCCNLNSLPSADKPYYCNLLTDFYGASGRSTYHLIRNNNLSVYNSGLAYESLLENETAYPEYTGYYSAIGNYLGVSRIGCFSSFVYNMESDAKVPTNVVVAYQNVDSLISANMSTVTLETVDAAIPEACLVCGNENVILNDGKASDPSFVVNNRSVTDSATGNWIKLIGSPGGMS